MIETIEHGDFTITYLPGKESNKVTNIRETADLDTLLPFAPIDKYIGRSFSTVEMNGLSMWDLFLDEVAEWRFCGYCYAFVTDWKHDPDCRWLKENPPGEYDYERGDE